MISGTSTTRLEHSRTLDSPCQSFLSAPIRPCHLYLPKKGSKWAKMLLPPLLLWPSCSGPVERRPTLCRDVLQHWTNCEKEARKKKNKMISIKKNSRRILPILPLSECVCVCVCVPLSVSHESSSLFRTGKGVDRMQHAKGSLVFETAQGLGN